MARKFVRNITGTKLKGKNKEPLKTNMQNDLLSDDEHVYVRNKDEYHCLTDNLKELTTSTPSIVTIKNNKNSANIDVKNCSNIEVEETEINSKNERLIVENPEPNKFNLDLNVEDIEQDLVNLNDKIDNIKLPEPPEINIQTISKYNPITDVIPKGFCIEKHEDINNNISYEISGSIVFGSSFYRLVEDFNLNDNLSDIKLCIDINPRIINTPEKIFEYNMVHQEISANHKKGSAVIRIEGLRKVIEEEKIIEALERGFNSFYIKYKFDGFEHILPINIPIVNGGLDFE